MARAHLQKYLWTLTPLVIAASAHIWLKTPKYTDIAKEPTLNVKIEVQNKASNLAKFGKQAFGAKWVSCDDDDAVDQNSFAPPLTKLTISQTDPNF